MDLPLAALGFSAVRLSTPLGVVHAEQPDLHLLIVPEQKAAFANGWPIPLHGPQDLFGGRLIYGVHVKRDLVKSRFPPLGDIASGPLLRSLCFHLPRFIPCCSRIYVCTLYLNLPLSLWPRSCLYRVPHSLALHLYCRSTLNAQFGALVFDIDIRSMIMLWPNVET